MTSWLFILLHNIVREGVPSIIIWKEEYLSIHTASGGGGMISGLFHNIRGVN